MLTSNTKFLRNPPQKVTEKWNKYNVLITHSIYERPTSNNQNQPGMQKSELWMCELDKELSQSLNQRIWRKLRNNEVVQTAPRAFGFRRASNSTKTQRCKTNKTFTTHNTRYCKSVPCETCIKRKWSAVPVSTETRTPCCVTFGGIPTATQRCLLTFKKQKLTRNI